jgi:hypothetical protein
MIKLLSLLLENQTNGVESFIETLKNKFQYDVGLWDDVANIINQSSCPEIKFEKLHPHVGGISKTDKCIINTSVLSMPLTQCLFSIFHEVAHQYQYKNYGKDIALDIYVKEDMNGMVEKLISIESTADRFGLSQTKKLMKKYNINGDIQTADFNNPKTITILIDYISDLRNIIKQNNLTNIEDINDFLYNMIKTQL